MVSPQIEVMPKCGKEFTGLRSSNFMMIPIRIQRYTRKRVAGDGKLYLFCRHPESVSMKADWYEE